MDQAVATGECFVDGTRICHVTDHDVIGNEAVRLEHAANLCEVTHQQPHIVTGSDERAHRIRAGEAGTARDENLHQHLLPRALASAAIAV